MSKASTTDPFPTRAQVEGLADRYTLALPNYIHSPRAGELAGKRTGSSVEYQDRKDFTPGDDLRHVDWRGYARSDRMTVKLYREEIMPRVDLVIDGSASMEITPEKKLRRLEAAYFFWLLARHLHGATSCWLAGAGPIQPLSHPIDITRFSARQFENPLPGMRGTQVSRPGGIRIFVSDLLYPFDPVQLESTLGRCDRLLVVQVLSAFEENPGEGLAAGTMVRLLNAEADEHLDVRLNTETVARYRHRLAALQADLTQRLQQRGGALAVTREDEPLDVVCRNFHRAGMIAI